MVAVLRLENKVQRVIRSLGVKVVHLVSRASQRVLAVQSVPRVLLLSQVSGHTVHFIGLLVNGPAVGLGGYLYWQMEQLQVQSSLLQYATCSVNQRIRIGAHYQG